ncbi:MAG: NAD-dependent epimerase/dehydratase family protein [Chloroflexota bacterium]
MAQDLVFVTGGTGFLGRHLVQFLLGKGLRVRLLVRQNSQIDWLKNLPVELVIGDVSNTQILLSGMQGCRYVIHAAGFFRFWGPYEIFDSTNLQGTKNIAKAALACGIEKLIYISTIAVVGIPLKGKIIDEKVVCHPQDPYQHSKLSAEKHLQGMYQQDGLPIVIIRAGAFYGHGSMYGFNRLFIIEPLQKLRVRVEKGERFTFPVFVPDVAKVIYDSLSLARNGETYNISDTSRTHNQVNEIVSGILGIPKWRFSVARLPMLALATFQEIISKLSGKEPFYPLNLRHYVFNDWSVSIEKAKRELNFEPTDIREGLSQTIEWIQDEMEQS